MQEMCSGIQWRIGKFVGVYEFYRIQANAVGGYCGSLSDKVNTCDYAAKMQAYQSPF